MNGLVVFDVDGTLTETLHVDDTCWEQVGREVLGIDQISTDWGIYEHSTDEAIVRQLIREQGNVPDDDAIVHRFRDRIHEMLCAASKDAAFIRPIPGANKIFSALADAGWASAVATGGWEINARFKLQQAGIDMKDVPAAFADDAWPREELLRLARERASDHYNKTFDALVYVGDGAWDLAAARINEAGFVGIGEGESRSHLIQSGATIVLSDFLDTGAFIEAVERAFQVT